MSPAKKLAPPLRVLVVVMWALSSVMASLRRAGPYSVDLEEFSPCRDRGSILVDFDVLLREMGDNVYYVGNLTFPYAVSDEDLLTTIQTYKWGSTGGWGQSLSLKEYDIMNYMKKTFPDAFKSIFGSIGVTGKPMPAGTYHVNKYFPRRFKIDEFPKLEYGLFKLEVTQSRNGTDLCCLQFIFRIIDIGDDAPPGTFQSLQHFG